MIWNFVVSCNIYVTAQLYVLFIIYGSSDHKMMWHSLLELTYWDELNSGKIIFMQIVDSEDSEQLSNM